MEDIIQYWRKILLSELTKGCCEERIKEYEVLMKKYF